MPEPLRVHGAAIEHELPQSGEPRLGEEGAGSATGGSQLDQATLQHGLHRGRDLRLVPSSPPRQVRRKMPSATRGSSPK